MSGDDFSEERKPVGNSLRYYIYQSIHPFDEDQTHEFKGHRNITQSEIPPTSAKHGSRGPLSKAINAFLNTGKGGVIYAGVVDNGSIKGINLSSYQMDHMRLSIEDTLRRYTPAVPSHRWALEFVPVFTSTPSQKELERAYASISKRSTVYRNNPHVLATHTHCWCDREAVASLNNGNINLDWVAEIVINPWNAENPLDADMVSTKTKIHPVHECEDGKLYFRHSASVQAYTLQEVLNYTKENVKAYYNRRNMLSL